MWIEVCEEVYDQMIALGMDDESEAFEDILNAVVECVCARPGYGEEGFTPLNYGARWKWHKIRSRYPDGECREHAPSLQEVFMDWKHAVNEQLGGAWALWEVLERLEYAARATKEAVMDEDGISDGEAVGAGVGAADTAEQTCDEDLSGHRAAGGGCAAADPGSDQEECLDYGTEDEETETNRILRAIGFGSEGQCRGEVGVSGPEPGAASDEAGSLEGRKKSWPGLPPMSEHRTSLYAKGVCR